MTGRVLFGNHPLYGYGLFVSKPGVDVLTAAEADMVLSSGMNNLVPHMAGTITTVSGVNNVYHGLGYNPIVLVSLANQRGASDVFLGVQADVVRATDGNNVAFNALSGGFNRTYHYMILRADSALY